MHLPLAPRRRLAALLTALSLAALGACATSTSPQPKSDDPCNPTQGSGICVPPDTTH